jgi:type I restriction enzyme, S subunit
VSLPSGWVEARFGDLVRSFQNGCGVRRSTGGTQTVVLRLADVSSDDGYLAQDGLRLIGLTRTEREKYRLLPGDLLAFRVNGSRAIAGRVVSFLGPDGYAFCDHFIRVRIREGVDSRFVGLVFKAPSVRAQVEAGLVSSAGQNTVSQGTLAEVRINLPPLAEQRRIVAKLEALVERSRRAMDALDAVPPLLERLRQSILAAAFRGAHTADWRAKNPDVEPASKLLERIRIERRRRWEQAELEKARAKGKSTKDDRWKERYEEATVIGEADLPRLPENWTWATADELCAPGRPIIYGIIKAGPHYPGGVPYVRVTEVAAGKINIDELPRCDPKRAALFQRSVLAAGDILVSKDGTIGRVAFVPPELSGGNINQHVLRVSSAPEMNREFFAFMIEAPASQAWMTGEIRGVALQGVNVEDFRRLPIPVAPVAEQAAIVERLRGALARVDDVRLVFDSARGSLQRLEPRLLAKAFRGELVPQDLADEPASVLLERIKAERARLTDLGDAKPRRAKNSGRPLRA